MTAATKKKVDIQREAICLSVNLGMVRSRKRINSDDIESDADRSLLHVSKEIFESKDLQAISAMHGAIHTYLKSRCLPSPFKHGVYLIRLSLVTEVMEELDQYEKKISDLIEAFLEFYGKIYVQRHDQKSEMRTRLGSLYNPGDYPAPATLKSAFKFETQLWEIGTPGALSTVSRALYEREKRKMDNVWEQAKEQITQVLMTELRDMTSRLTERLTPNEDGTKKVFRDSLIGNLQEWLDVFKRRALTDDQELIDVVEKARQLIAGVDAKTLRTDEESRKDLSGAMGKLTTALEQSIIEKPARKIDLDD